MLPLQECVDQIADTAHCTTLFDIANRIRCVAFDGVKGCGEPECAEGWRSYVTVGPIQDPHGNSLIVSLNSIGASPASRNSGGFMLGAGVHVARFDVILMENGWPMLDTDAGWIMTPDWELINAIAGHSYSHGETMYRSLVDKIQKRSLFMQPTNSHIGGVDISDMRPFGPQGPIVGWQTQVSAQVALR